MFTVIDDYSLEDVEYFVSFSNLYLENKLTCNLLRYNIFRGNIKNIIDQMINKSAEQDPKKCFRVALSLLDVFKIIQFKYLK